MQQDQDGRSAPARRAAAARLVAAADFLTVGLVLLALTIVLFKGFRFDVAGIRLSATDFGRPLILAGLLTLVRHGFVRRPTLRGRLRQVLARRHTPPGVSAVLWPFAVSRLGVLFTGLMAVYAIGFREAPPFRVSIDETLNLLARFDTGWYWSIAQHGYSPGGNLQHDVAFFPLYPLLMAGFGRLLGGYPMIAGFVVSLGAFLGALVYVYRLGAAWCEREDSPGAAVALLAFYPFAIFFGLVYSESVFLLCAAGAIYHVFRRHIVVGTIFAFAAGLTRPNGFLLAVPLALLALSTSSRLQGTARRWLLGERLQHTPPAAATVWSVVPVLAPVLAVLAYSAYVAALTGAPFAWATAQEGWGREYLGTLRRRDRTLCPASIPGHPRRNTGLALRHLQRHGRPLRGGRVVAGDAALWPGARSLRGGEPASAHAGRRECRPGALYVRPVSPLLLDGRQPPARPAAILARRLRRRAGPGRVSLLHVAPVVLTMPHLQPDVSDGSQTDK